jgi:tRNA(fMet)-specific endonuclease VapC
MKYLLDTNVVSELVARQPNPRVVEWLDLQDPDEIYLSVITVGEIRKGIAKLPPSKRKQMIQAWLESDLLLRFHGRIVEIGVQTMLKWGELAGRLEKSGKQMSAIDSLIAALALEGDFTLVTRNEQDFENADIAVVNPWK